MNVNLILNKFWQAGLRILTYEKKSCFKIEKLSVSLTANNIANSNYWTFSCLFKLFTLGNEKEKKKTHTSHFFPILLKIFWGIIENMGQIRALFSHPRCRPHVLINLPLLTWNSCVNLNQNRFPLDFHQTLTEILSPVTRTLDNSSLPLTRSNFQ